MPLAQTGKQRAKGVPPNYFKQAGPLGKWRDRLTLAALVAALAWWASGVEFHQGGWPIRQSARGRLRASRGSVTHVHASWEANCNACHVPFHPIVAGHWWDWSAPGKASASDQRCIACHAGPPHHGNEAPLDSLNCASCHQEHRGRDASLVRVADSNCTECHEHLALHTRPGAPTRGYHDVTRFATDHPEFRAVVQGAGAAAADPGNIEFNHALHLTRGLVRRPGDVPFTLDRMAEMGSQADVERYRTPGQADADAVQLSCASCHRADSGDSPVLASGNSRMVRVPARSPGAHMLPITYEADCRACHPLTIEPTLNASERSPSKVMVPHGLQPDEVHEALRRAFVARYLSNHDELLDEPVTQSRIPDRPISAAATQARSMIDRAIYKAEQILYLGKQTCSECHRYETPPNVPVSEAIARSKAPELRVKPSLITEVWFEHAVFDHAAHRALSCKECHGRAYPKDQLGKDDSISSRDVLLPGIATCRQCHAPTRLARDTVRGGASYDCTECHRYHNGDAPLRGRGAARRNAGRAHEISEFLTAPHSSAAERRH